MTGTTLNWTKYFKAEFSAYCEVNEEHKATNIIDNACTNSAICIGPNTYLQGSYNFLCLNTGKRITPKQFSMVPMPASMVKLVEELATIDSQFKKDLTFEDRDNIPIEDTDDINEGAATTGV